MSDIGLFYFSLSLSHWNFTHTMLLILGTLYKIKFILVSFPICQYIWDNTEHCIIVKFDAYPVHWFSLFQKNARDHYLLNVAYVRESCGCSTATKWSAISNGACTCWLRAPVGFENRKSPENLLVVSSSTWSILSNPFPKQIDAFWAIPVT